MGSGMMMRMIFTLMDGDGDGSLSLEEFQAAHARIFKGMDANKDGKLTIEDANLHAGSQEISSAAVARSDTFSAKSTSP